MVRLQTIADPQLITLLVEGKVGVMPTDTVYGLACLAADKAAVERLYELKHRQQKPGTVIAADTEQLVELGIPRRYLKAVEHFWPNPISVVVPTAPALAYLDMGRMSLALRIPKDPQLTKLLSQTGPLLTTSANPPGEPAASTIQEAEAYFGKTVDFYVDGGDLSPQQPSTIIRIVDDAVEVLREGAVTVNEKGEVSL